ncbi:MAG: HipA N-terminal domain-containing protein [Thiohalospira sp.]
MSGPSAALRVHLGREPVGRLWLDEQRRFRFRYDKAWLERAHTQPLSLSLPLGETVFHDEQARPFFANLLPESELRRRLARRLRLLADGDELG